MSYEEQFLTGLAVEARALEPRSSDVESAVRRARVARQRTRRSRTMAAFAALAALTVTAIVPGTRQAVADAIGSFFGSSVPDHHVTGARLSARQLPRWLIGQTDHGLVVAGRGQNRLIAFRDRAQYCFAFGSGVGICDSGRGWRQQLANHPVVLYGPTHSGTRYGLTRGDIAYARFTFVHHAPITAPAANGGFAVTTKPAWGLHRLYLLDSHGQIVEQQPVP